MFSTLEFCQEAVRRERLSGFRVAGLVAWSAAIGRILSGGHAAGSGHCLAAFERAAVPSSPSRQPRRPPETLPSLRFGNTRPSWYTKTTASSRECRLPRRGFQGLVLLCFNAYGPRIRARRSLTGGGWACLQTFRCELTGGLAGFGFDHPATSRIFIGDSGNDTAGTVARLGNSLRGSVPLIYRGGALPRSSNSLRDFSKFIVPLLDLLR
jgi:hypothetical protein